ncbi:hypothetical protein ACFL5H_02360 [Candidatus Latescibacterota bacterium]
MKKIFNSVAILILIFVAYSCSKDHDAPTFSQYSNLKKPTNVVASYNKVSNAFTVTWDMANTTDVIDYYISVSDSANFNGITITRSNGGLNRTSAIIADFIPAEEDTVIRYFAVHAVYNNENLNTFIGPRSDDADSALFIR